jgi:rRNA processing protein Gar1
MHPLGKVVNVTPRGQAVARPHPGNPAPLRVGMRVADNRGRDVGRIQDLIGPVREPYILIATARHADVRQLLGQDLYEGPPGPPRPPEGARRGPPDNRYGGPPRGGPRDGPRYGPPPGGQRRPYRSPR